MLWCCVVGAADVVGAVASVVCAVVVAAVACIALVSLTGFGPQLAFSLRGGTCTFGVSRHFVACSPL